MISASLSASLFDTHLLTPAASDSATIASLRYALNKTISWSGASRRMRRATSKPGRSGIWLSSSTTVGAGEHASNRSIASAPLAASLTTSYFSNACWGAAPPILAFGMDFLALAALAKRDKYPFWIAPALGGMAVGLNVMEAADIGALFSMLIAAFVVYQSLVDEGLSIPMRAARGIGRTILVAVFAGFIAAYAVSTLIGANIKGIAGTQQDEQTRSAHWDFATQWSMPKRETLALIVPNLYGCTVITPGAANYWGGMGTDPAWDRYFASGEQGPPP